MVLLLRPGLGQYLGRAFSSQSLNSSLESLASELVPAAAGRGRGRRQRTPVQVPAPAESTALTKWEDDALGPHTPADGMLVRQQDAWHQQLSQDRIMELHSRIMARKAFLKQALEKPKPPTPVVDTPPEEVVQDVFSSLVVDPQEELRARRDFRRAESLALQLEHLLACPPQQLHKVLKSQGVRIAKVASFPQDAVAASDVLVYFECDGDEPKVQRRLTKAAPALATALARRLLITSVPSLRFAPVSEMDGEGNTRELTPSNWRSKKRRILVYKAMQSWAHTMNWC